MQLDRTGAPAGLRRLRPVVRPGEEPPDRGEVVRGGGRIPMEPRPHPIDKETGLGGR